jgi:hypothetical protein
VFRKADAGWLADAVAAMRLGVSITAGHRSSGDRSGWIRYAPSANGTTAAPAIRLGAILRT